MLGEIHPDLMSVHLTLTKHRLKMTETIKGSYLHFWTRWSQSAGATLLLFFLPVTVFKCIIAASSLREIFGPPQKIKSFLFPFQLHFKNANHNCFPDIKACFLITTNLQLKQHWWLPWGWSGISMPAVRAQHLQFHQDKADNQDCGLTLRRNLLWFLNNFKKF